MLKINIKKIISSILLLLVLAGSWILVNNHDVLEPTKTSKTTARQDSSKKSKSKQKTETSEKPVKQEATATQEKKSANVAIVPAASKEEKMIIKSANGMGLSQEVLHLALKAYHNVAEDDKVDNHKLTIIDYSMPSNMKRMWLIDMDKKAVELNTYVSHGVNSGDKVAKDFSNSVRSHKSSIGVMKTGSIYQGGKGMSLNLHGLEAGFNSNVYKRRVVIHGTEYVSDAIAKARGKIGKSFGCPAVDYKISKQLIKKIANGSVVFAYYPLKSWLKKSEYLL